MQAKRTIIGLTGSFGSGCSYIAKEILCSATRDERKKKRYEFASLTASLKKRFREDTGRDPQKATREELQDFGDRKRKENGIEYFANIATQDIAPDDATSWIVDSIRNPGEVHFLRDKYPGQFYLLGVYADREVRWNRVGRDKFNNNLAEFEKADERDTGKDSGTEGQRVGDCFLEADAVIEKKDDFEEAGNTPCLEFEKKLDRLLERMASSQQGVQAEESGETLMTAAYAIGQRSSCIQRKVGALIVDPCGHVISSGFNEVPHGERDGDHWSVGTCAERFKQCFRKRTRETFLKSLEESAPELAEKRHIVKALFEENVKLMDLCKAVHAEENAILAVARNGHSVPLSDCTLYTTTFPCRLCANKIVTVGLRNVIYVEPYPDPEAKTILESAGIKTTFFEGITYRAYFRIYGKES